MKNSSKSQVILRPTKKHKSQRNTPSAGLRFSTNSSTRMLPTPRQTIFHTWKTGPALVLPQTGIDSFTSLQFQLNDVPENGAMLIMWSLYQITEVELQFRPMYRANPIQPLANGLIPEIYVAYDSDSTRATPIDMNEMRRYADVTVTDDSVGFVVRFRPRFAKSLFENLLLNTYEPSHDNDWLPTIHNKVPHYSIFVGVTGSGNLAGPFQAWNVVARYHLAFKLER